MKTALYTKVTVTNMTKVDYKVCKQNNYDAYRLYYAVSAKKEKKCTAALRLYLNTVVTMTE